MPGFLKLSGKSVSMCVWEVGKHVCVMCGRMHACVCVELVNTHHAAGNYIGLVFPLKT